MPIAQEKKFHGFVLSQILTSLECTEKTSFRVQQNEQRSSYVIEVLTHGEIVGRIGLFIKTSQKRRSPWNYTFTESHQIEISSLASSINETFLVLVNNDDGVTVLDYKELKQVLDDHFDDTEWIRVSRKLNSQYAVSGKDGELKGKVSPSDFPKVIVEAASEFTKDESLVDSIRLSFKKLF